MKKTDHGESMALVRAGPTEYYGPVDRLTLVIHPDGDDAPFHVHSPTYDVETQLEVLEVLARNVLTGALKVRQAQGHEHLCPGDIQRLSYGLMLRMQEAINDFGTTCKCADCTDGKDEDCNCIDCETHRYEERDEVE